MEFRNITSFLKLAECKSFTKAAESLGYSQSAITVQIQQLENELGVKLFERIGKKVKLTHYGEIFRKEAVVIMQSVEKAKDAVCKDEIPSGSLHLGVIESLSTSILPEILLDFQQQYPQVQVCIKTGINAQMYDMVNKNEIDMIYYLDQIVNDADWIKVIENDEPVVFVASHEHLLACNKPLSIDEVLQQPLILTEQGLSYRYDLEQYLATKEKKLTPILEIGNTDVIVTLLQEKHGISFLPYFVVKDLVDKGILVILDVKEVDIHIYSQLVYHKNKLVTPQMRAFIEVLKKHL